MANTNTLIQIKHSTVAGNVPGTLANGELAINTADSILYFQDPQGNKKKITIGPVIDEGFPANPYHRQLFWSAEEGALKIYYIDGDGTGQWVDTNGGSNILDIPIYDQSLNTTDNVRFANVTTSELHSSSNVLNFSTADVGITLSSQTQYNVPPTILEADGYPWIVAKSVGSGAELSYTSASTMNDFYAPGVFSSSLYINRNGLGIDLDYNELEGTCQSWTFDNDGKLYLATGGLQFDDGTTQNTAYTGGGVTYDQSLNTTDNVQFTNVKVGGSVEIEGNTGTVWTNLLAAYNNSVTVRGYGNSQADYVFKGKNNFGEAELILPTKVVIKPDGTNSNEYVALQSNKFAELKVDSQFPVTTSIVGVEATEVYIAVDTAGQTGNRSDWSFTTLGMQFPDTTRQLTAWNGTEKFYNKTGATGVVEHDCANGAVFYHTSIAGNFTADITSLPLGLVNTTGAVTLVLSQGATPYVCNAVQINGSAQTILWQGSASAPTGNANKTDIISFSIMRTGANPLTYIVFGQLVSFG